MSGKLYFRPCNIILGPSYEGRRAIGQNWLEIINESPAAELDLKTLARGLLNFLWARIVLKLI